MPENNVFLYYFAEIADFMQSKENAKKTLSDIEDAYRAAAKEKGFL